MKFSKTTALLAILPITLSLGATRVAAQEILFHEDFNQATQQWQYLRSNGGQWYLSEGRAGVLINTFFVTTEIVPRDAYWDDSWRDYEFAVEVTPLAGIDQNLAFQVVDERNFYDIHFTAYKYELSRVEDGQVVFRHTEPFILRRGQAQTVRVNFVAGRIKISIDDQPAGDFFDPTFSDQYGKISLKGTSGTFYPVQVLFDNVIVTTATPGETAPSKPQPTPSPQPPTAEPVVLNIPTQKQTDPAWAGLEYDHAMTWSNQPSIARWGCALSSLSMIMNYHGLKQLPDGRPLNPGTLNDWLRTQPDGYVGTGLLNWLAATRLSREINSLSGTPKLEYSRVAGSSLDTASQEILTQKPSILQIDGHFLVAKGWDETTAEILITDPWYDYERFSQHQTAPLSTRLFQPSYTDLSYLLLVGSANLKIEVRDENGQLMNLQNWDENIQPPQSDPDLVMPQQAVYALPKPASGDYHLALSQAELDEYSLEIYSYDQAANVSLAEFSGWVGQSPEQLQLYYQKDAPSQVSNSYTLLDLQRDLDWAYQRGLIKSDQAYDSFSRFIARAIAKPRPGTEHFLEQIQKVVQKLLNQPQQPNL